MAIRAVRDRFGGVVLWVAIAAVGVLAMGCGGSDAGVSSLTDSITGFGALNATWVREHQVMTSHFPAECTSGCKDRYYDPQASGDARLDVVARDRNRVVWLDVMPVPFETRQQIIADAIALLPPDAVQVDMGQQAECATVQFRSETLGAVFRKSGMEDVPGLQDLSLIDVVMFSGDVLPSGDSPPYTPNKITEAQIHSGYAGSAKETPCS